MKMTFGVLNGVLAAVLLFGAASAQSSCDCELEVGASCVYYEWVGQKQITCQSTSFTCDRCVCVAGGSMSCLLGTGTSLDSSCNVISTTYAECPAAAPAGPQGWVLGAVLESCDDVCTDAANPCFAPQITDLNSVSVTTPGFLTAFVSTQFGLTVTENPCGGGTCVDASPVVADGFTNALAAPSQVAATCSATYAKGGRICCCSPDGSHCPV